jgi:hypothetical protein
MLDDLVEPRPGDSEAGDSILEKRGKNGDDISCFNGGVTRFSMHFLSVSCNGSA